MSEYDCDVVVVGMGPMGATTALALASYGISVQMINKRNWVADSPRAHITNQRAAEVLRDLGLESAVLRHATPWDQIGDTLFTTSLAGTEVARLRAWGTGDALHGNYQSVSPCPIVDIPQSLLEPVLIGAAAERGAKLTFNTEYVSHEQDADGVTVSLFDRVRKGSYTVRARYLVGADGANSRVAADVGLEILGEKARAGTIYAQFDADLTRYVAHRPSILHWIMNPEAGHGEIGMGLLRAVRPWDKWIAGWGFDTNEEPDLSPENAIRRIRLLVGDPNLEATVTAVAPWYVNQAWATSYSSGRVFCGGDAVHMHPPSNGLGSNTSLQDGYNLAWKIAYVIKGYAQSSLLDSYSEERVDVGSQVVARANRSRVEYRPLVETFYGTDRTVSVDEALKRVNNPQGAEVRDALKEAVDLKNYEYNAHGIELNHRYESGAVLADPTLPPESWEKDTELFAQPAARPGAKLPHAWLVGSDGRRLSTLDVVGKGHMSLLTGLAGEAWVAAAESLGLEYLSPIRIGEPSYTDPYFEWRAVSGIAEAGALLVRPDGVIAWRHAGPPGDQKAATELLQAALAELGMTGPLEPRELVAGNPQFADLARNQK
ncbi:FAD-dependent monooxygenase [Arthrobacter luteolus]|uniref:FAD-dependent monooxygenase n=1 Tax=Arthrobacter luteolus TaxID=98672 RepID=UPI00384EE3D1